MNTENELLNYRKRIDQIDQEILDLIKKRFNLLPKIIEYKNKKGLPIYQPEREKELLKSKKKLAKELNLSEEFIEKLFLEILKESKRIQESN